MQETDSTQEQTFVREQLLQVRMARAEDRRSPRRSPRYVIPYKCS